MRRLLVAAAIGATAALTLATPALASTMQVCPTWTLHSTVDNAHWTDAADGSEIVDGNAVTLTKPAGGGTEFATADAGIELAEPGDITVDYVLSDEADFAAGAIRLFYYDTANAHTLTAAPTAFVAADKDAGTLTIEGVTKVGTLGLVYDASNAAAGSVTFTGLKVGGEPVSFTGKACEPSPSPSVKPSPSKTAPAGAVPATTTPAAGNAAPSLPVTGASIGTAVGIAVVLLAAGGGLFLFFRRRRIRFTA